MNDENQNSNDDPAMLDSVKDLAAQPAAQVEPPQMSTQTTSSSSVSAQPQSAGFNMVGSAPAGDPVTAPSIPTDTNDSQIQQPTEDSTDEVAHAEPAPGFSNAAEFAAANQPQQETVEADSPLPDNTIPQPAASDTTPAIDKPEPSPNPVHDTAFEPPKIIGHTNSTTQPDTAEEPVQQTAEPTNDLSAPPDPATIVAPPADVDTTAPEEVENTGSTDEQSEVDYEHLASLKKEALGHLEQLSDKLEGDPIEVFRTTMQMIQANDNHTLIQQALEAAKNIQDDAARAQAMQDIINEINYFSPQNNSQ